MQTHETMKTLTDKDDCIDSGERQIHFLHKRHTMAALRGQHVALSLARQLLSKDTSVIRRQTRRSHSVRTPLQLAPDLFVLSSTSSSKYSPQDLGMVCRILGVAAAGRIVDKWYRRQPYPVDFQQ